MTKDASSESRNRQAEEMSAGVPRRPNGVRRAIRSARSGSASYSGWIMGVRIAPGQIVFERIRAGPYCSAMAREREIRPALDTW